MIKSNIKIKKTIRKCVRVNNHISDTQQSYVHQNIKGSLTTKMSVFSSFQIWQTTWDTQALQRIDHQLEYQLATILGIQHYVILFWVIEILAPEPRCRQLRRRCVLQHKTWLRSWGSPEQGKQELGNDQHSPVTPEGISVVGSSESGEKYRTYPPPR